MNTRSPATRFLTIGLLAAGAAAVIGSCALAQTSSTAPEGDKVLCMARYTGSGAKPPERWDDIFWENDRIAHRIYGPAVSRPAPNGEGLVTSGIDVWVKSVRVPFMGKQLAAGH